MTKEQLDELMGLRHLERESWVNDGDQWRELIRLARLGLWSEKYRSTIKIGLEGNIERKWDADLSADALAALPEKK